MASRLHLRLCLLIVAMAVICTTPPAARAAQAYDNCTGFIDALPATITAQGTWCLRGSKYTSQVTGAAITVRADNVTLDCNGFRVSGLGAGASTRAIGVQAPLFRKNVTVRDCRIQGFRYGVQLQGDGHVVEDNHFYANTYIGVYTYGDDMEIRNNYIGDTGGMPGGTHAYGIYAQAFFRAANHSRVLGNTISGVSPVGGGAGAGTARGILASGLIQDNHVRLSYSTAAIRLVKGLARDNVVVLEVWDDGANAIVGDRAGACICQDNDYLGYSFGSGDAINRIARCQESGTLSMLQPFPE